MLDGEDFDLLPICMVILPQPYVRHYKMPKGRSPATRKLRRKNTLDPKQAGTLYPSGKFTMGFIPRRKISKKDFTYQAQSDTWDCNYSEQAQPGKGIVRKYSWVQQRSPARFIESSYLGKSRKNRGSTGLTRHGKRVVNESCYILEREYGVKNLGFYTLTIPTCSVDEAWEICFNWAKVYKYFFKLLRNHLYATGYKELYYVGVSENQRERAEKQGCPFYHIHFVMPCYSPGSYKWRVSADTLRILWKRAVCNVCPTLAESSFSASVDAAVLRKSASGYLSKYFSKGTDILGIHSLVIPKTWYFCSLEMKTAYKAECKRLSGNLCDYILESKHDKTSVLYWNYLTTVAPGSDREVVRGYYGQLSPDMRDFVFTL